MATTIETQQRDKVFRLTRATGSRWSNIATHSTKRRTLRAFDPEKKIYREIRYSTTHTTPWVDEQEGVAHTPPIEFIDGMLYVEARDLALLNFLAVHPDLGKKFVEVDKEADAEKEYTQIVDEVEALIQAKQLKVEDLDLVGRILFGDKASKISTAELKRDVLVYAKKNPSKFLAAINDPNKGKVSRVQEFFDMGLIRFRDKKQFVHYNLEDNKKRMCTLPPNSTDPIAQVVAFFETDEGLAAYEMLDHKLETMFA